MVNGIPWPYLDIYRLAKLIFIEVLSRCSNSVYYYYIAKIRFASDVFCLISSSKMSRNYNACCEVYTCNRSIVL